MPVTMPAGPPAAEGRGYDEGGLSGPSGAHAPEVSSHLVTCSRPSSSMTLIGFPALTKPNSALGVSCAIFVGFEID